jgi:hypothetical protein
LLADDGTDEGPVSVGRPPAAALLKPQRTGVANEPTYYTVAALQKMKRPGVLRFGFHQD